MQDPRLDLRIQLLKSINDDLPITNFSKNKINEILTILEKMKNEKMKLKNIDLEDFLSKILYYHNNIYKINSENSANKHYLLHEIIEKFNKHIKKYVEKNEENIIHYLLQFDEKQKQIPCLNKVDLHTKSKIEPVRKTNSNWKLNNERIFELSNKNIEKEFQNNLLKFLNENKVENSDRDNIDEYLYYNIAKELLDENVVEFIYPAVFTYTKELIYKDTTEEQTMDGFQSFLSKALEFYEKYLINNNKFKEYNSVGKEKIIFQYLQNNLPDWIYEETDYNNESLEDDNTNNIPYDVTKIDIINNTYQAEYLYRRYKFEEIQLSPDYQRNFVWTSKQKSRLIESMLIQIPLPIFYIDARDEDKWIVIDGLQRLSSIFYYLQDDFKLSNLEYLKELNGKRFSKLERKYQRRIEECQLQCNIIRPNTPPNIAFNIFQRINTLGTKLEVQEIRNAMYLGASTDLLGELSRSEEFINIVTQNKINALSKRMEDHAIILRYLAFKITNYMRYDNNDMNDFLSNTMSKINNMHELEINQLKIGFKNNMKKAYIIFDNSAFRKPSKNKNTPNPISKTLFETIGNTLEKYSIDEIEIHNKELKEKINLLFTDKEFTFKTSIATNNPPNVRYRFEKINEVFKNIIGH
jgi:hypothetical protein